MRINKYLAQAGIASRREADRLVVRGEVKINGKLAKPGDQVEDSDLVTVKGQEVAVQEKIYILFYKPVGVISTDDPKATNTVFDYLDVKTHLFYVGRLDVASSGLMLLTNDGDLAQAITKPANVHEKEYEVTLNKQVTRGFLAKMSNGVTIQGRLTKPAITKKLGPKKFSIVLTEGRNRQIRRMCEALGFGVEKLKRIRIMHLTLGDLQPGQWRNLTKKEVGILRTQTHED